MQVGLMDSDLLIHYDLIIIVCQVCHAVSRLVDEEGDKILREVPEVVKIIKEHITLFNKMASVSNEK